MYEKLTIKLATIDDIKKVFELSNEKIVRQNSINKEPILWENHQIWFKNRIKSIEEPFYIVELKGEFVAQVRFDKRDDWEISISITPEFRAKGLASQIINQTTLKSNLTEVVSLIQEDNISSIKAFEKAGYKRFSEIYINEIKYIKLIYKH